MVENPENPGAYDLVVAVVAPAVPTQARMPFNLVFSVDTSCSMGSGGLDSAKAVMTTIAAGLDEGDVVSLVTWSATSSVVMDSHLVTSPNDPTFLENIDTLAPGGSTNLNGGLTAAYALAAANHTLGRVSRVVLISDGGANVGVTNSTLIGTAAEDGEMEGIYLIGVGTPPAAAYNSALMDTVTDVGKGAYVYIESATEAARRFAPERLPELFQVAARDVQLGITLAPGFVVDDFTGEEIGGTPSEVTPQHLAPNAQMIYDLDLLDCSIDDASPDLEFTFTVQWDDPLSGLQTVDTITTTVAEMLAANHKELDKASAIVAYAIAYEEVPQLNSSGLRGVYLDGVITTVADVASTQPGDTDLAEILATLDVWRALYP
jgi:Ca-activated chloride channel family protein